MKTWHAEKGANAALTISVVAWLATFFAVGFYCAVLIAAWEIGRFGLFGPRRSTPVAVVIVAIAGIAASLVFATILARTIYQALRRKWADL